MSGRSIFWTDGTRLEIDVRPRTRELRAALARYLYRPQRRRPQLPVAAPAPRADISFWFDPVCPFAWITSKWVRAVAGQRDYIVDWRFISLRLINADIDYDSYFPPGYDDGHTSGLRLLRVAARARAEHGPAVIGPLYEAFSSEIFDSAHAAQLTPQVRGSREFAEPLLAKAGLPAGLADALDDTSWDAELRAETDYALSLTGRDVGTPIIQFQPPHGIAFFGPVISRPPAGEEAVRLWDHVIGLAAFPGFAELKRSLRERPQLSSFGVNPGQAGAEEDWQVTDGRPADPVVKAVSPPAFDRRVPASGTEALC